MATFLLCLAFLYDIFWVFLSPELFGESVMVKVATGGEITQDPTYCEKYPTSSGCQVRRVLLLIVKEYKSPLFFFFFGFRINIYETSATCVQT